VLGVKRLEDYGIAYRIQPSAIAQPGAYRNTIARSLPVNSQL
jgi:hypothetical protein